MGERKNQSATYVHATANTAASMISVRVQPPSGCYSSTGETDFLFFASFLFERAAFPREARPACVHNERGNNEHQSMRHVTNPSATDMLTLLQPLPFSRAVTVRVSGLEVYKKSTSKISKVAQVDRAFAN